MCFFDRRDVCVSHETNTTLDLSKDTNDTFVLVFPVSLSLTLLPFPGSSGIETLAIISSMLPAMV